MRFWITMLAALVLIAMPACNKQKAANPENPAGQQTAAAPSPSATSQAPAVANPAQPAKNDACAKPPELAKPAPTDAADKQLAKKLQAQGSISAVFNEAGDFVRPASVKANSKEAAEYMVNHVKTVKYKPRPGCGEFQVTFNFKPEK